MKDRIYYRHHQNGTVLLTVLFVVMAIAVLGLGVLGRSDMDLAGSSKVTTRMQMDYIAYSGLEHARTLLIHPYDVDTSAGYWAGQTGLQIDSSKNIYYDLSISDSVAGAAPYCSYTVTCLGYQLNGADKMYSSSLQAVVYLTPCVAYFTNSTEVIDSGFIIRGDLFSEGTITNNGLIQGDVYCKGSYFSGSGTLNGTEFSEIIDLPLDEPDVSVIDFQTNYYLNLTKYWVDTVASGRHDDFMPVASANNPAAVFYCNGNLELRGDCIVNGTLVVNGDLVLEQNLSGARTEVVITSEKNFPAIVTSGQIVMNYNNSRLTITGLTVVQNKIDCRGMSGLMLTSTGGLYSNNGIDNVSASSTIKIFANAAYGAVEIEESDGDIRRLTPAVDACIHSIIRP